MICQRLTSLSIIFILLAVPIYFSNHDIGFSTGTNSHEDSIEISAGSSPTAIVFWIISLNYVFYFVKTNKPAYTLKDDLSEKKRSFFSRYLNSFAIDTMVLLTITGPLITLPILLLEAKHNGFFQWYFYRDYYRVGDGWVQIFFICASFAIVYLYCYLHYTNDRQTIGQFVTGLKVKFVKTPPTPKAILTRLLLAMIWEEKLKDINNSAIYKVHYDEVPTSEKTSTL